MYLLDVPDDVLEKILTNLSFDEVSRCRLVCQRFNEISKRVLNHGFLKVEKYHGLCLRTVKAQLPRRESERRIHPLARHCDILTAIETRLSLLSSTFKKFIDLNICCFIPGKVLDEIFRVLRYITTAQSPIRTHDILQELRDLSSMAMEYFDEKIAPILKSKHKETGPQINILCSQSQIFSSVKHLRPSTPVPQIYKLSRFVNELAKRHNSVLAEVASLQTKKKEFEGIGKRITDLEQFASDCKKKLSESEKSVAEQQVTISQQEVKLSEQELKIEKLSKIIERQYGGFSSKRKQNVSRCKVQKALVLQRAIKRKLIQNQKDEKNISGKKKFKKCVAS